MRRITHGLLEWVTGSYDVLDFGCGTGLVAEALSARGYRVTAVDPSVAMIGRARKRNAADSYHVATRTPGDRQFDSSIIVNVLQACDDPRDVLTHVAARTSGCVIAVWPEDDVALTDLARWEWHGPSSALLVIRSTLLRIVVGIPGILLGARRQSDPVLRKSAVSVAESLGRTVVFRRIPLTGCIVAVLSAPQSATDTRSGLARRGDSLL